MRADGARIFEHGKGRRRRHGASRRHDAVEPLALDDGVEKNRPDRIARRLGIRFVENRHQIVHDAQPLAGQTFGHFVGNGAVAGIDDFAVDGRAADGLGIGQDVIHVAAVGAAGKEQDIRRRGFQRGDVLARQPEGKGLRQLGARRLRRDLTDFNGHFRHQADRRDGQPALGRRGILQPQIARAQPRQRVRPGHVVQDAGKTIG